LAGTVFEFGDFKLDCGRFELYRAGRSLKLERKPMELLILLAERNGDLVTRSEIAERLWEREVFVDTEHGINTAIRKIRQVLRDDPEQPRFLVTVTGKGYRFIGTMAQVRPRSPEHDDQRAPAESNSAEFDERASPSGTASIQDRFASYSELPDERNLQHTRSSRSQSVAEIRTDLQLLPRDLGVPIAVAGCDSDSGRLAVVSIAARSTSRLPKWAVIAGAALVVIGLGIGGWLYFGRRPHPLSETDTIVLADFSNSTGDAVFDDTLKQALGVSVQQSPFFNVVSDQTVAKTLQLMTRPPDTPLTPDVARELCQRAGSRVYIAGSIAKIGTEYVVGLKAVSCASGGTLAQKQAQAAGKEKVLDALGGVATKLRSDLGESLNSVQTFDTPIEQATTASFEALKACSLGRKNWNENGDVQAIPFYQRAIELDPNFAMAHAYLGLAYFNLGEESKAVEHLTEAYQLRDRVTQTEKFFISSHYFGSVTREVEKGIQNSELWTQTYPRDPRPQLFLGAAYANLGRFEEAAAETRKCLNLDPDFTLCSGNLIGIYTCLDRLDEAKAMYRDAIKRKPDSNVLHLYRYTIAFLESDVAEMERQVNWASGKSGVEDGFLAKQSKTEAFYGRLGSAREFTRRAIESARRNDKKEVAAESQLYEADWEALFGNSSRAQEQSASALTMASNRSVKFYAGLALAWAGYSTRAESLADEMQKRFPLDTVVNRYCLPTIRASIEINRSNPGKAIEILKAAAPSELGVASGDPIYVRGQAYLLLHEPGEAAVEFRKILDHRSIIANRPTFPLAHLGLARAYALQARSAHGAEADAARAKARAAYQDFFTLWKDADPGIPVLKQAKAEYSKLQ
jgi:DNA-binding winged helix-turn-helix (wHTH) protein/tetratricopeptide (TPR) repeat protein